MAEFSDTLAAASVSKRNARAFSLQYLPPQFMSVILGVMCLGRVWRTAELFGLIPHEAFFLRVGFSILATMFILVYLLKAVLFPLTLCDEAVHPYKAHGLSTGSMAIMMLGKEIGLSTSLKVGEIVWFLGIALYFAVMVTFCVCRVRDFIAFRTGQDEGLIQTDRSVTAFVFTHVHPGWLVPGVGILIASVTSQPFHELDEFTRLVSQSCFWDGIVMIALLMPVMTWRLLAGPPLPDTLLGSLGIYVAPPFLSFIGWQAHWKSDTMSPYGIFLNVAGGFCLLVFLTFLPRAIKTWFRNPNVSYGGMTFPLSAVATGLLFIYHHRFVETSGETHMLVFCWSAIIMTNVITMTIFSWFLKEMVLGDMLTEEAYHGQGIQIHYKAEPACTNTDYRAAAPDTDRDTQSLLV